MLLTLFAIAIGSLIGLARGGKWAGPSSVTFTNGGFLVIAVTTALVQIILDPIFPVLWTVVGTVALIAFAARNRHLTGMSIVLIGSVLNLLPILLNGAVPVSELALLSVGNVDEFGNPAIGSAFESTAIASRLSFLSHGIPVPVFGAVVSIGDLIVLVGLADIVTNFFLAGRTQELSLAEAGVYFASDSNEASRPQSGAAHAAHAAPSLAAKLPGGRTTDGLISILSPIQVGERKSSDRERRRVRRNKQAPTSHVPAHAADSVDTPTAAGSTDSPAHFAFFGPESEDEANVVDPFAGDPFADDLIPSHAAESSVDEPTPTSQPVVAEELIDPVWAEPSNDESVGPVGPIVINLTDDGEIAPVEGGGLFDQDSHIAAGAPVARPPRPEIPKGADAITAAGMQAVPVLPATARAPETEPVPELIDLTDPNDPRPIIDLTKSPTDEQMAEFLRRRKAADRNLERVPIRPPGQRRGRAPVRISVDREDGVAKNHR